MVTNRNTNKMYIGQTVKDNPEERWRQHRSGHGGAKHLTRAINKYGEHAFEFNVICECSTEDLDDLETFYVDYYGTFTNGYNLTKGGGGTRGIQLSDTQKEHLSKLFTSDGNPMFGKKGCENPNSGKTRTLEMIEKYRLSKIGDKNPMYGKQGTLKGRFGAMHPSSKKVERLDLITEEVTVYDNQKIAAELNNIKNPSLISACCRGKRKTTGGFAWRHSS